ncbi:MAG: DUF4440 domain-containing protein [Candidatus Kariarchaeaceae archaeon]
MISKEVFYSGTSVQKEVIELHQFFQDWFNGKLKKERFDRVEKVIGEDFELINPDGEKTTREQILNGIRDSQESRTDMEMWVEDVTTRRVGDLMLTTYYEVHRENDMVKKRMSSALFAYAPNTPNYCQWLHVHETWSD